MNSLILKMRWDKKASVWMAVSKEIGLVLEDESLENLLIKLAYAVPELIELNREVL